jgi:hypothetical protein
MVSTTAFPSFLRKEKPEGRTALRSIDLLFGPWAAIVPYYWLSNSESAGEAFPIDGRSETVSPSKMSFQSVGRSSVTNPAAAAARQVRRGRKPDRDVNRSLLEIIGNELMLEGGFFPHSSRSALRNRLVSMVSRDLWTPHDHDANRSRHDQCLDNLVPIRPHDVGRHHSHVQQNASASELSE